MTRILKQVNMVVGIFYSVDLKVLARQKYPFRINKR